MGDKGNIAPARQTQVEPCDLYAANDGHAAFGHIKISTFSAALSHLFNQGTNAISLLKLDNDAVTRLRLSSLRKEQAVRLMAYSNPLTNRSSASPLESSLTKTKIRSRTTSRYSHA